MLKAVSKRENPSSRTTRFSKRQLAIFKSYFVEIFATHCVETSAHEQTGSIFLNQHATDTGPPGLLVHPGKDDEHPGLVGPADQRLDPIEPQSVADDVRVGLVVGDVSAGIRLGHADSQDAISAADCWQNAAFDVLGRVGRDDTGLGANFAKHRHGRDITTLGNFLQHQGGIKNL